MAENDRTGPQQPAEAPAKPSFPSRLRLPLNTLRDVQRELARVYRAVKADQMPLGKGRTLVYTLSQLSRSIEGSQLEQRIALLEQQLQERV